MDDPRLTKYQKHQLKKATIEDVERRQKSRRRLFRYGLWVGAVVLLIVTFWQVDKFVAVNSKNVSATTTSSALVVKPGDWFRGATSSAVVLIEYSDFQCPACAEYDKLLRRLEADYPQDLVVIYRHYPWFFHPQALNAAWAAEAAGAQGQFWAMHDLLFTKQSEWSVQSGQEIFVRYAQQLGLKMEDFKKSLSDQSLRQKIDNQLTEGKNLGIDYTPAFALNGKIIQNPKSYEEFKQTIDQALKSR